MHGRAAGGGRAGGETISARHQRLRMFVDRSSRSCPRSCPPVVDLSAVNEKLMQAAENSDVKKARIALAAGADANTARFGGRSPLMAAANHPALMQVLLASRPL